MADDGAAKLFFYSIVGVGIGAYLFVRGFGWLREKRLIENTPTSKIRSIAMGRVEVYGEVVPVTGKLLKSPFTNKDCVYCRWTIEEYRSSGKSSRWVTVKKGIEKTHFYLKDNTGKVLVDPSDAIVDIPKDYQSKNVTPMVETFLESIKLSHKGILGLKQSMRFTEYYLAPKDKVYVMGTADDNPYVAEATSQMNEEDIMIQRGKKGNFYYISDKPEKDVVSSFKWKVIGGLFGGGALIIACLFYIFWFLRIL